MLLPPLLQLRRLVRLPASPRLDGLGASQLIVYHYQPQPPDSSCLMSRHNGQCIIWECIYMSRDATYKL